MLVQPDSPSKTVQARLDARKTLRAMTKTNEDLRRTVNASRMILLDAHKTLVESGKCLAQWKD